MTSGLFFTSTYLRGKESIRKVPAVFTALLLALLVSFTPWQSGLAAPSENSETTPTQAATASDPVFFIGTSGLALSDVDFTNPTIQKGLARTGIANTLNRSSHYLTCPIEGWMQLAASGDVIDDYGRALSAKYPAACAPPTVTQLHINENHPGEARVNNFAFRTATVAWPETPVFPADTLGIGDGAAVALANKNGFVPLWYARPSKLSSLSEIIENASGTILLDLGNLTAEKDTENHRLQKEVINERLAQALTLFKKHGRTTKTGKTRRLIVASLGDAWRSTQLQFFATDTFTKSTSLDSGAKTQTAKTFSGPGIIHSETTRADSFTTIANTRDSLQATNPALVLLPTVSLDTAVAQATEFENHALLARLTLPTWYTVYGIIVAFGVIAFIVHFLRRPASMTTEIRAGERNWRGPNFIWRNLAWFNTFAFALIPAALVQNFIPWWTLPIGDSTILALFVALGLTAVLAVTFTYLARSTPYPIALLSALALIVLAGDIVSGSAHQRNGFMGSLVLTSRRFYGISNRTYLILVVAGLLMTLPWIATYFAKLQRKYAAWGVVASGLLVLAVDAVPQWGADFGGPPGIIAGFGITALLVAGVKLRWWHGLVWVLLSVSAMGAAGLLDASSSTGESSHIGKFWATLGTPESLALIAGKIRDVLRSFTGRLSVTLTIIAVLVLAALLLVVLRRLQQTHGIHRQVLLDSISTPGFLAVTVGILVGIGVAVPINDSGALMLKEGIVMALPALAAIMSDRLLALRKDSDFTELAEIPEGGL